MFCSECKSLLTSLFLQHFVSERKYDEELGRSARFSCDTEQLKTQIQLCGESKHWWSLSLSFSEQTYPFSRADSTCAASVRVCSKPSMSAVSGCSRTAGRTRVNFTFCNMLDSLCLGCTLHLQVPSTIFVRDFQVLLRWVGVFNLNRIPTLGNTQIQ